MVHRSTTTPPQTEPVLSDISKSIEVASARLLANVSEAATDPVIGHLGGTIVRRSAADVELEIATARRLTMA